MPTVAVMAPAGTANLLATDLEVPGAAGAAVQVRLHGSRRELDTGHLRSVTICVSA